MPDWRLVTQVDAPGHLYSSGRKLNQMWVDIEGVDTIMVLPEHAYTGGRSRLGWMTSHGWYYIHVAEQIDPTQPGEANNKEEPP